LIISIQVGWLAAAAGRAAAFLAAPDLVAGFFATAIVIVDVAQKLMRLVMFVRDTDV
jgi:hypothetical protein